MKIRLDNPWKELQKKLPTDQIFYLLVMLAFTKCREKQMGVCSEGALDQNRFRKLFLDVPQYDLKESVFRFCEKVDWPRLENDKEIQLILEEVEALMSAFFAEDESNTLSEEHSSAKNQKSKNLQGNHSGVENQRAGVRVSERDLIERSRSIVRKLDILLQNISELMGTTGEYVSTPYSIQQLIGELVSEVRPQKMADFCCGTAIMGIGLWERLFKIPQKIWFYGTDIDSALCDIGKILLFLHGIEGQIERRDLLTAPAKEQEPQYDFIVMDIPRGNNKSEPYDSRDLRLKDFNRKTIYSDWIFIQEALYSLKDGGYAVVLCTTGALIRANEKMLREKVVVNDWLEAVITLPVNLYPNTRTGTELLIFHKGKVPFRSRKILFVDVSRYYFREKRNAYSISEEGRELVCSSFQRYKEIEGVSVIRKTGLLDFQTFSLKPIQYIQQETESGQGECIRLFQIAEIVRGAQIGSKEIHDYASGQPVTGTAHFINIKDIQNDRIVYDTAEQISTAHPACKEKFRIREDDILITSKGTAIKTAIVETNPPPAFISGNITLLRVDQDKYDPYVLLDYLNSEAGRVALERIQSGTTIRILNNANLKELKIPKYNPELMKCVGAQLKKKREHFYKEQKRLIETYQKETKLLLDLLKEEL